MRGIVIDPDHRITHRAGFAHGKGHLGELVGRQINADFNAILHIVTIQHRGLQDNFLVVAQCAKGDPRRVRTRP